MPKGDKGIHDDGRAKSCTRNDKSSAQGQEQERDESVVRHGRPFAERLSCNVNEIPGLTGISKNAVDKAILSGDLPLCRINHKSKVVKTDDIERWIDGYRSIPADEKTLEAIKRRRPAHGPASLPDHLRKEQEKAMAACRKMMDD